MSDLSAAQETAGLTPETLGVILVFLESGKRTEFPRGSSSSHSKGRWGLRERHRVFPPAFSFWKG